MMLSLKNLIFLGFLAAFTGQACTQSNFTGSGSAKRNSSDAKKDAGDGDDKDDADGKDQDGKDQDGKGDGAVDSKDVDDKGKLDGDGDSGGGGNLGETDECLKKRADSYNFMMIFDRSKSQERTDPNFVRRDGALAFVDRVYQYVQANTAARVYMTSIAFSDTSQRSANGWQRLKDTTLPVIKQDITAATSTPDGGTVYSPALKDAANYFEQINKQTNPDRTRNYVVFLTDGEPNALEAPLGGVFGGSGESVADINNAVKDLVNNYGVAMIAIASGTGIAPQGEAFVQSMALPTTGIKDKNHVGLFRRTTTPDELKAVFDKLLSDIGTCN